MFHSMNALLVAVRSHKAEVVHLIQVIMLFIGTEYFPSGLKKLKYALRKVEK